MRPRVSCHNFPVIRSPSLAHLFVLSTLFETWECSSTTISERLLIFVEPMSQLRHLRRYVTDDCFRSLVVSLVHSRLDYGNFVLVGLLVYLQRRLQSVLNAAARLVFLLRRYDHVTDALATLHWLCLPQCVDFKVAVMAFRVLHGLAPPYLNQLAPVANLLQSLPTSVSIVNQLLVSPFWITTVGLLTFPVAGSLVWNSLPSDIQASSSLSAFRQRFKTFLFRQS